MGKVGSVGITTTLLVLQVVFGKPLREKEQFQNSDVEDLLLADCGSVNIQGALRRLVELDWLTARKTTVSMYGTRGGNPVRWIYTRTTKGENEYRRLVRQLKPYGIILR